MDTTDFTGTGRARYCFSDGNSYIELTTAWTTKPESLIRLDGKVV
jgi:hypothetical protein